MPIDTGLVLDDVTKNLVEFLEARRNEWGIREVIPFEGLMKSTYPRIEVNVTDATFERIESGGGYMCDVLADVLYFYQQFKDSVAKEELDRRSSEIGFFLAEHPTLGGYSNDLILEAISIIALREQTTGSPVVVAVIRCRVQKEIFLEYH